MWRFSTHQNFLYQGNIKFIVTEKRKPVLGVFERAIYRGNQKGALLFQRNWSQNGKLFSVCLGNHGPCLSLTCVEFGIWILIIDMRACHISISVSDFFDILVSKRYCEFLLHID